MLNDKNLIEIVKIDGSDVAIERQSGNCKVNLTNMGKRFGKQPIQWLRTREAQEFLAAMELVIRNGNSHIESNKSELQICSTQSSNLIITSKGNSSNFEQGTWCTDYRIAIRFAMWLDPIFAVFVIDTFMRIMSGEHIVSEEGYFNLGGKQWVSCFDYCKILHRTAHSFYGLKGHYPKDFIFWDGQWYMSRELFSMKDLQAKFENHRLDIKSKYDEHQLSLPFTEVNMEG